MFLLQISQNHKLQHLMLFILTFFCKHKLMSIILLINYI